jgi:glutamate racemase
MGQLIARFDPAAVVIACNTASTLVLPPLRARFTIPFVGTVPAIKPAAEQTESGVIAVLATLGTMKRDYTHDLVRSFARSCHVRLVGAPLLATIAEARMRGEAVDEEEMRRQIKPCFVEIDGARTDIVVLACTHYPFLADRLAALAPWPVKWLDPAPAIARRLATVLAGVPVERGPSQALFTSGKPVPVQLAELLGRHGFSLIAGAPRDRRAAPARADREA